MAKTRAYRPGKETARAIRQEERSTCTGRCKVILTSSDIAVGMRHAPSCKGDKDVRKLQGTVPKRNR